MENIMPFFILILISAIFVRGIVRYVAGSHKCNKHELYFEDELSRGTFCSVCNKTIDEEIFKPKK